MKYTECCHYTELTLASAPEDLAVQSLANAGCHCTADADAGSRRNLRSPSSAAGSIPPLFLPPLLSVFSLPYSSLCLFSLRRYYFTYNCMPSFRGCDRWVHLCNHCPYQDIGHFHHFRESPVQAAPQPPVPGTH